MGYLGIGVVSTILGVVFRRAQIVLSIVVLVLAISFVALPGFQVNLLPFTQLIIDANASLLSLGNGILPFDEPILSGAVMVSLGLIAVGYVVGTAAFARVRW
ncbi:MAG: hypothetical protein GY851_03230 [bacterium]|nr:hypothetical protein [bacterium]